MQHIPFDHLSARLHRPILARVHTTLSRENPTSADLRALAVLHAHEYGHYLSNIDKRRWSPLKTEESSAHTILDRFADLPATSRAQIAALRSDTLPRHGSLRMVYRERTTGSSGRPHDVCRTAHSVQREMLRLRWSLAHYSRCLRVPLASTVLYLSHYPNSRSYTYTDLTAEPLRILKHAIRADSLESDLRTAFADVRDRFVIAGTASTLHLIATSGVKIGRSPLFVLASGEIYPEELRRLAADEFQCAVYDHYVMREFGLLGASCHMNRGIHLFSTDFLATSKDGVLRITDLTNHVDVHVNYVTGDRGILEAAEICDCGLTWPLLTHFSGRPFAKPMSPAAV